MGCGKKTRVHILTESWLLCNTKLESALPKLLAQSLICNLLALLTFSLLIRNLVRIILSTVLFFRWQNISETLPVYTLGNGTLDK